VTPPLGHLALPAPGAGRPVLVLHAWWGLNDTMKSVCDRLAAAGFAAFAPDLYRGRIAGTIADAEALAGALDANQTLGRRDVAAAARFLVERCGRTDTTLAVIGFSLGASYALDLSASDERVRAVVLFYGTGPGDFAKSRASYLGHFAESDDYEPPSNVEGLASALHKAGRPVAFHRYAGTGHWFCEPDRQDAFHPDAAALAWERTLTFLQG
jgi:carboxymethylenebutenolidase